MNISENVIKQRLEELIQHDVAVVAVCALRERFLCADAGCP